MIYDAAIEGEKRAEACRAFPLKLNLKMKKERGLREKYEDV